MLPFLGKVVIITRLYEISLHTKSEVNNDGNKTSNRKNC